MLSAFTLYLVKVIPTCYRSAVCFVFTYNNIFSGEPFNQEELEEMLSAAVDPNKGNIQYKDYVSAMSIEET